MIDHTRPLPDDSDSEPNARLDDFQVFRRAGPYIYSHYYGNSYRSPYFEPPVEDGHYHNLVNARENYYTTDDGTKTVNEWSEDDTVSWIVKNLLSLDYSEQDFPYYNYRMTGNQLGNMSREEFRLRAMHSYIPPESSYAVADAIYDKLQLRLCEEQCRQPSVLTESDPYAHDMPQIVDLDNYERNRHYVSDYAPNNSSLLPVIPNDDVEDHYPDSQRESPDYYGSDESIRSDDKDSKKPKNKMSKRPPGRPPGSGCKNRTMKRPRNVSVPEFLRDCLLNPATCPSYIKWENYLERKFRFVKPDLIAKMWGQLKNNEGMTFEKFSRAMRYHYRQNVLEPVPSARLVYKFGSKFPPINGNKDNPNFETKPIKTEYQAYEVCC